MRRVGSAGLSVPQYGAALVQLAPRVISMRHCKTFLDTTRGECTHHEVRSSNCIRLTRNLRRRRVVGRSTSSSPFEYTTSSSAARRSLSSSGRASMSAGRSRDDTLSHFCCSYWEGSCSCHTHCSRHSHQLASGQSCSRWCTDGL